MKAKKWWVIGVVVLVVLPVVALLVGPELWARSWEKKWEEFRTEWEAKGEEFGVEAHWHDSVPDEENVAMHPFMRQLTEDSLNRESGRWNAMKSEAIDAYNDLPFDDGKVRVVEVLRADPGLRNRLRETYSQIDDDRRQFAEALARPHCVPAASLDEGIAEMKAPWHGWTKFAQILQIRVLTEMAEGNEGAVVSDLVSLIRLGNHLRESRSMKGVVLALGTDALVDELIDAALEVDTLGEASRKQLIGLLEMPHPGNGEVLARVLRFERGLWLREVDRMEAVGDSVAPGETKEIGSRWLPDEIVLQVFLARNRLGISEDLQNCLLAPDGVVRTDIRIRDLSRYDEAVELRFAESGGMDALAAMALPNVQTTAVRMERVEERRLEVLKRLRE